ncbi:unnamed protein product [Amoebophrya sp. A120]|nr:unnamed protein product [Amoebophrya sp. A120]|eukprot:GSA120T00024306001.1
MESDPVHPSVVGTAERPTGLGGGEGVSPSVPARAAEQLEQTAGTGHDRDHGIVAGGTDTAHTGIISSTTTTTIRPRLDASDGNSKQISSEMLERLISLGRFKNLIPVRVAGIGAAAEWQKKLNLVDSEEAMTDKYLCIGGNHVVFHVRYVEPDASPEMAACHYSVRRFGKAEDYKFRDVGCNVTEVHIAVVPASISPEEASNSTTGAPTDVGDLRNPNADATAITWKLTDNVKSKTLETLGRALGVEIPASVFVRIADPTVISQTTVLGLQTRLPGTSTATTSRRSSYNGARRNSDSEGELQDEESGRPASGRSPDEKSDTAGADQLCGCSPQTTKKIVDLVTRTATTVAQTVAAETATTVAQTVAAETATTVSQTVAAETATTVATTVAEKVTREELAKQIPIFLRDYVRPEIHEEVRKEMEKLQPNMEQIGQILEQKWAQFREEIGETWKTMSAEEYKMHLATVAEERAEEREQTERDAEAIKRRLAKLEADEADRERRQKQNDRTVRDSERNVSVVKHELFRQDKQLGALDLRQTVSEQETNERLRDVNYQRQKDRRVQEGINALLSARQTTTERTVQEQGIQIEHNRTEVLEEQKNARYVNNQRRERLQAEMNSNQEKLKQQLSTTNWETENKILAVKESIRATNENVAKDKAEREVQSNLIAANHTRVLESTEQLRNENTTLAGTVQQLSGKVEEMSVRLDKLDEAPIKHSEMNDSALAKYQQLCDSRLNSLEQVVGQLRWQKDGFRLVNQIIIPLRTMARQRSYHRGEETDEAARRSAFLLSEKMNAFDDLLYAAAMSPTEQYTQEVHENLQKEFWNLMRECNHGLKMETTDAGIKLKSMRLAFPELLKMYSQRLSPEAKPVDENGQAALRTEAAMKQKTKTMDAEPDDTVSSSTTGKQDHNVKNLDGPTKRENEVNDTGATVASDCASTTTIFSSMKGTSSSKSGGGGGDAAPDSDEAQH